MKRWIWWLLGLAGLALVLRLAFHFPWDETGAALAGTNGWLLTGALLVNLISPVAKGWAWHLLLGALAPNRWWVAQEANLIGTAVNVVGVGVTGEAARVSVVMRRDHVPIRAAIVSVVGSRIVEALGLAVFMVVAPLAFDLPPAVRVAQFAGGILLLATFVMVRFRMWERLVTWLPQRLRPAAVELGAMGRGGRLLVPTILAIVNWGAQWATYDLALRATHVAASPAAAFTALLAVNLGGIIRITPANAGVTQAAMAAALLPFAVPPERGVAAGLALQAIQVLPILAIGLAIAGRAGFRRLTAEAREVASASAAARPN